MTFIYWLKNNWDISYHVDINTLSTFFQAMNKLSDKEKLYLSTRLERGLK